MTKEEERPHIDMLLAMSIDPNLPKFDTSMMKRRLSSKKIRTKS